MPNTSNDPFVIDQAKKWGQKLAANTSTVEERITLIYAKSLGRKPTPQEIEKSRQFLKQQSSDLGLGSEAMLGNAQVWTDLCHVMFNLKEFIYVY